MVIEHKIIVYEDESFPFCYTKCKKNTGELPHSHWHEDIEFIYVTDGDGILTNDEEKYYITAGDLVIINSNNIHSLSARYSTIEFYCFQININLLENFGFDLDLFYPKTEISDIYVITKFKKIIDQIQNKTFNYKISVKIDFLSIFLYMYNASSMPQYSNNKHDSKKAIIKKSIKYLKEHLDNRISVDTVAKSVGLNKYYFCHAFKEVVGKTMLEYLNALRINHATQLLLQNNFNISQIAFTCGFETPSYFTKVFKRKFGITPNQYRKKYKKTSIIEVTEIKNSVNN